MGYLDHGGKLSSQQTRYKKRDKSIKTLVFQAIGWMIEGLQLSFAIVQAREFIQFSKIIFPPKTEEKFTMRID
jgi:hypothetical protein